VDGYAKTVPDVRSRASSFLKV